MHKHILTLALALSLIACTSVQVVEPSRVVESTGTEPRVGATSTVPVGGTLLSQYRLWSKSGTRIPSGYTGRVGGAQVIVAPTDYLVRSIADGKEAYCTERLTMHNLRGVPTKPTCFVGSLRESTFTHVMVPADAIWWGTDLPQPLRFEQQEVSMPRSDSMRRELIYLGAAAKVIRLAYREYLGDLARPAFAQDVSYDVGELPMQVAFRNARFEVLSVSGSSITYRVLSPL